MSPPEEKKPRSTFTRFLDLVEWLGNALPHPVTLFIFFAIAIVGVSGLAGMYDLQVQDPRPLGAPGRSEDGVIRVVSLVNGDGLRKIMENLVTNFTGFVPLGTVLVALMGVGVAEASGLLTAFIRGIILRAPKKMVTTALVFAAVLSNVASEMGYVVIIPLGGIIFLTIGKHPLAGIAAAFAGVSGGYSASFLIGTIDPLLAGITEEAAKLIDPTYTVHPAVNWYFMSVSTFLVTAVVVWVTEKIVEPKLGPYDPSFAEEGATEQTEQMEPLSAQEKKGLLYAGLAILGLAAIVALGVVPEDGVLRNPATGSVLNSPFLRGMVAFIFIFFLVPGVVYGATVGTIRSDKDVIKGMSNAMGSLGLYIVLVFFAAQFVAFFAWTNLGAVLAVAGADLLERMNLTNPLVFLPFILMCTLVNLTLASASAQWAVTAPIFVPMLMLVGYSPEVIQTAYRIGDSCTTIITPMMAYFGLILAFAARYDRRIGIGTIISMMLPYTMFLLVGWTALFYIWIFGLGLPVGPGAPTYYP